MVKHFVHLSSLTFFLFYLKKNEMYYLQMSQVEHHKIGDPTEKLEKHRAPYRPNSAWGRQLP